jgi:hypothetical protein
MLLVGELRRIASGVGCGVCEKGGDIHGYGDLGASIVTGIDGNPLAVVAKQLRIPLYDINSEGVPLYMPDGSEPDAALDNQVRWSWTLELSP